MRTHVFAQASLFSVLSSCLDTQRCYLPNGDWDGGSEDSPQPCNTEAEFSHCCGTGAICLSNGYCYEPSNASIYRSSCTDETWQSASCPTYCNDVDVTRGPQLYTAQYSYFCCGIAINSSYCSTATQDSYLPFELQNAYPINNRTDGSTSPNATTSTAAAAARLTVTGTAKADNNNNHDVAIGAGVGVSLGILLAAAVAALVVQTRRLHAAKTGHHDHTADTPSTDLQKYPSLLPDESQRSFQQQPTTHAPKPELAGNPSNRHELFGS